MNSPEVLEVLVVCGDAGGNACPRLQSQSLAVQSSQQEVSMATLTQSTAVPVGTIKQFGPFGPEYEVLQEAEPENGRRMARIVLVRTGEVVDYPLDAILLDQEAQ
jgi:hypothetical protein